jgi:hypothetical protein
MDALTPEYGEAASASGIRITDDINETNVRPVRMKYVIRSKS